MMEFKKIRIDELNDIFVDKFEEFVGRRDWGVIYCNVYITLVYFYMF